MQEMAFGSSGITAKVNKHAQNPRSRSRSQYPDAALSKSVVNNFLKRHNLRPGHLGRLIDASPTLLYRWRHTQHRPSSRFAVRMLELEVMASGLKEIGLALEHIEKIVWELDVCLWTEEGAKRMVAAVTAKKLGFPVPGADRDSGLGELRALTLDREHARAAREEKEKKVFNVYGRNRSPFEDSDEEGVEESVDDFGPERLF